MSKNREKITGALQKLGGAEKIEILSGQVESVDKNANTMTVNLNNSNLSITDVLLNGGPDRSKGVIIYPTVGSDVVIGTVDGPEEYVLIRASDIDTVKIITETDSLGQWLRDLMAKLQAMTFTNGGGTTGFANNAADLVILNQRLDQIIDA